MVPHDVQPICQEMLVKVNDDIDIFENKKKRKTDDSDFNAMINKTKQQGEKKNKRIHLAVEMSEGKLSKSSE
jgi:ABC-type enterochelin transport system substrate-binding protein